jgi:hypothetical protein
MSGRIWVVEENMGSRAQPAWWATSFVRDTRALARRAQLTAKSAGYVTRVVQYVRQGGAR